MPPRPRRTVLRTAPKRQDAQASVAVLLDATERVAREVGFEAATTTKIAKVAGVAVGTLYRYFPSKNELLAALVRRQWELGMQQFTEQLRNDRPGTLDERVEQLVGLAFDTLTERLVALGEMKVSTNDLVQLDADVIEAGAMAIASQLASRREKVCIEDERCASVILVRAVVFLARIGVRDYPDLLASGSYRREVTRLVSGYLFRGTTPDP